MRVLPKAVINSGSKFSKAKITMHLVKTLTVFSSQKAYCSLFRAFCFYFCVLLFEAYEQCFRNSFQTQEAPSNAWQPDVVPRSLPLWEAAGSTASWFLCWVLLWPLQALNKASVWLPSCSLLWDIWLSCFLDFPHTPKLPLLPSIQSSSSEVATDVAWSPFIN